LHTPIVNTRLKPLDFIGSSQDDLRSFPAEVRHALGVELMRVQFGGMPVDIELAAKRYKMIGARL
jgi:phage-related protein